MNAYDYNRQEWISGQAAIDLRQEQLKNELDLLQSAQGEEYAKFIGVERMDAIVSIQTLIRKESQCKQP